MNPQVTKITVGVQKLADFYSAHKPSVKHISVSIAQHRTLQRAHEDALRVSGYVRRDDGRIFFRDYEINPVADEPARKRRGQVDAFA